MSNSKYLYDFPENKAFKNGLMRGDYAIIARNTGYSEITIKSMLNGIRKMNDKVKDECLRIAEANNIKLKIS